jgi:hypothetical protein
MPVSTNQVRIDTQASGALWTGQAVPATMREAAKQTLAAGYTFFKLSNVGSGVGQQDGGLMCSSGNGLATCANISRPTAATGALVTFYHSLSDPGAQGAFDARQVLVQYGS